MTVLICRPAYTVMFSARRSRVTIPPLVRLSVASGATSDAANEVCTQAPVVSAKYHAPTMTSGRHSDRKQACEDG